MDGMRWISGWGEVWNTFTVLIKSKEKLVGVVVEDWEDEDNSWPKTAEKTQFLRKSVPALTDNIKQRFMIHRLNQEKRKGFKFMVCLAVLIF